MTIARTNYSDILPVGYQLEEFRFDALLGEGGFSKVYPSPSVDGVASLPGKESAGSTPGKPETLAGSDIHGL